MEFKSIIVIIILFLSALIVGWNFDLRAKSLDNETNNNSTSRSNKRLSNYDFDWGEIEVISEPIAGQNINVEDSWGHKIAIENEKIFVVWQDKNNTNGAGSTDWDIFYKYFDGSNWSKIQVISEPILGFDMNTYDSIYPDIAVESGNIYVVWQDKNNTNGAGSTDWDIFYRCNLTGTNWEDIQVISEPIPGKNFKTGHSAVPSIAVENGKIYVVWHDSNNTNGAATDQDIFLRYNFTGSGWENIQVISEPIPNMNFNNVESSFPEIAVENGRIYVVWQDYNHTNGAMGDPDIFFKCNLTGFNWELVQVISEPIPGKNSNTGDSWFPDFTVENDKIYIVWVDDNDTNGAGTDRDIFYRCNLTGSSWEDIQVISEPIPSQDLNIQASTWPEIAIDNGRIYVVWQDNNDTNYAGLDADIFYKCNFTGSSWEPIQVISEPIISNNINIEGSSTPNIAVYRGKSHVVWDDYNNTNGAGPDLDIFYRWIKSPFSPIFLGLPSITPTSGNTSMNFIFSVTYYHLNNTPPTRITVNISDKEYTMLEVNSTDDNYVDGKNYFFNIKNLDIGMHTYQFYASDGKFTWSTPLFNKPEVYNTPPNITTENILIAIEDVYYEVDYEYEDIDVGNVDQVVTWKFSSNADWLIFNPTTAILNGTPTNDNIGEYWVNITIDDTIDIDYTNFTLTVINVNDAPVITTHNIIIATEDEYYEVDYEAVDIDTSQDNLTWTMNTSASWLEFELITVMLSGTPTNNDVGKYWVNISVSDTEYADYSNFTLEVINVNDPPKIIMEDVITAAEDEYYEVDYEAEDVDNAPGELIWTIDTNAEWLTYDTKTAIINGTPENNDVGEYWVYISVSDMEYIDFTNFTLTVLNTNDPPVIITEDKTSAIVSELYSVNYEAEDIDPPPVTLIWSLKSNASDWLTIDSNSGWLNGKPSQNDIGSYWVNVSIWDGENGWDYSNFTLYVTQEPEYGDEDFRLSSPKMTPTDGDTETGFTFSIHYYNSENKAPTSIQLIVDGNVYNMTLKTGENTSNGTYEYKLKLSEGIHTYYFTASNGTETVKTDNFATPYIEKVDEPSKKESLWYWLIWLIIILIIIASLIFLAIYKKRKAAKIPTVRAELLYKPPEHIALPGVTSGVEGARALPPQPTVIEQFPTLKVPVPSLAPTPVKPLLQLPQATLTKAQQLNLLRERLLRGEISEETYKELKVEIECSTGREIAEEEITVEVAEEEQSSSVGGQQQEPIAESAKPEVPTGVAPPESEPAVETPQELPKIPEAIAPQPEPHESIEAQPEQTPQESPVTPEVKIQQMQTIRQQPKSFVKNQTNEEQIT